MKVNLTGAIGGENFGDEFILNACMEEYLKLFPCDFIFSGFAKNVVLRKGEIVTSNDINFFDCMSELQTLKKEKGVITDKDVFTIFDRYSKSDIVHLIGGGYVNNLWPSNYALVAIAYLYGIHCSVPVVGTGLGLYPAEINQELVELFQNFDFIDVRDEYSHKLIPSSIYTGDDALLKFNDFSCVIKNSEKPFLAISIQNHLFDGEDIIDYIFSKEFLRHFISNGINDIIVIEAAPEDNVKFSRGNLQNATELAFDIKFITGNELIENGIPYHPNSKVISSRYHINLLYTMLGLEGVAIIDNDYYENKHNSIVSVGGKWPIFNKEDFLSKININALFNGDYIADFDTLMKFHKEKKVLFERIKTLHSGKHKKIATEVAISIVNDYLY
ncbi:polysaccharide pyruvyl transferase family protein [Serratia proteamaculans]|uniref:polysaccharide pyruvyl transferase family protein n=1 Tax=Serratia proteamaculans TaxID=28151 RepID=UPI003CEF3740